MAWYDSPQFTDGVFFILKFSISTSILFDIRPVLSLIRIILPFIGTPSIFFTKIVCLKKYKDWDQQELSSASLISNIGFLKTWPNNLWQLMEGGFQTDEERPQGSWQKGDFWLD